jgi:hypothetical protein
MKNRAFLAIAAAFVLLAAAAPARFDIASGLASNSAMARGGADDGAGHDAGDNHGNDGPNHR